MTGTAEYLRLPPLGLYVHLPWCVSKCPYCDFNSHPARGELPFEQYITALLEDLDHARPSVGGREVSSIYFGGGTPSLFSAAAIGQLLEGIACRVTLAAGVEITLEANPGTVERDAFGSYRRAGVNRVSLGVQSFQDQLLRSLGRIHDHLAVMQALESLDRARLDNFNIDLMFGLPGQTLAQAQSDMRQALAAGPAHLSYYQLTLEPNTAFARTPPSLPAEEDCWAMQEASGDMLSGAGFEQYEISAWARPGRQCAHNLNYWRHGDFLGLGAGAHGKTRSGSTVTRLSRPRHPRTYLARSEPPEHRVLSADDLVFEFFLNRLRLREGFRIDDFESATGLPWSRVAGQVGVAFEQGLLEQRDGRILHTDLGWRFVNDIQALFLPAAPLSG